MLWNAFEIVITLIESVTIVNFLCGMMGRRYRFANGFLSTFLGAAVLASVILFINSIMTYEGIWGFIYSVVYFLISAVLLEGSVVKKIILSIITNLILICVSAFSVNLISEIFRDNFETIYREQSVGRVVTVIFVQALYIGIFHMIERLTNRGELCLHREELIGIAIFFVISIALVAFIHTVLLDLKMQSRSLSTVFLTLAEGGIMLINFAYVYNVIRLSEQNLKALRLQMVEQQYEYQLDYAVNVKKQFSEARRIRHDMKQTIAVVKTLLRENKLEEASAYLEKYESVFSEQKVFIHTENDFLNAILNSKLSIAKEKNIEVLCSVSKQISGIDEIDLCCLVGNLLDNAIEANEKVEDARYIQVDFFSDEVKLVIKTTNPMMEPISGGLSTTKQDHEQHGFGIKTVESIAKKYNGTTDFYADHGCFTARVLLYKS